MTRIHPCLDAIPYSMTVIPTLLMAYSGICRLFVVVVHNLLMIQAPG